MYLASAYTLAYGMDLGLPTYTKLPSSLVVLGTSHKLLTKRWILFG